MTRIKKMEQNLLIFHPVYPVILLFLSLQCSNSEKTDE